MERFTRSSSTRKVSDRKVRQGKARMMETDYAVQPDWQRMFEASDARLRTVMETVQSVEVEEL